jgi:hypothetical protein
VVQPDKRGRSKYALESRHAMSLVELRTLRQVGDMVKILQLEKIRSAFSAGRNSLRGDDLRETALRQKLSQEAQQGRLNSKYVADDFIANRQRTIFNQRLWTHGVKIRNELRGDFVERFENATFKDMQFTS